MNILKKYPIPFAILLLVAIDQITKYLVQHNLEIGQTLFMFRGFGIKYVINKGMVFHLFEDFEHIRLIRIIGIPIIFPLSFFLYQFYIYKCGKSRLIVSAFIFVMAGAIGNYSDIAVLGYARDFLVWPGPGKPNLADLFVDTGLILFTIELIRNPRVKLKGRFFDGSGTKEFFSFSRNEITKLFSNSKGVKI
ncbi:MAG: signal peptidase II [candidate division Zixibacteria bacterium]|nr:signal peptidase II [candidate division Zixibacteria bacterium]